MNKDQREGIESALADVPLDEARETLQAIRDGEVDAFVVHEGEAPTVYLLKDPDRLYQVIIERMSEGAVLLARDGTVLYGNGSFAGFVGLDKAALPSRPFEAFVVPEHQRRLAGTLSLARLAPAAVELDLAGGQGALPVYLSASPIDLADWNSSLILVVTDLTTRRRSEHVAAAAEFVRAVLDQAAEPIIVCDNEGIVTHASLAAQALCASTPLGRPFAEAFPICLPGGRAASPNTLLPHSSTHGGHEGIELEMVCEGGQRRHFLGRESSLRAVDGTVLGRIATLADITDRKRAELALEEEREVFRNLADIASDYFWEFDERFRFKTLSPSIAERSGLDYRSCIGRAPWELAAFGLSEAEWAKFQANLEDREPFRQLELGLANANGDARWFSVSGDPIRSKAGRFLGYRGTMQDITAQKSLEKALRENESYLRQLIDTLPGIVWTATRDGGIDFISPQWFGYTGMPPGATAGEATFEPIHPEDRERFRQIWQSAVRNRVGFHAEYRLRRHDGKYRWFKSRGTPIRDTEGNISRWLGIITDIDDAKLAEGVLRNSRDALEKLIAERTAELLRSNEALTREKEQQQALIRKLAEAQGQLVQSEKMASIGQLAAGVAHEINNPIGFVSSNLESLKVYAEDLLAILAEYERKADPLVREHPEAAADIAAIKDKADLDFLRQDLPTLLRETREGIQRVRKIVQDLKEFSHVSEVEWQRADLHKGMDSTLNVVWNELKYKAKVFKEYGEIPPVECLPSEINQVFMNLLVNAADAIVDSGIITIRSGGSDGWVWVEVADNGAGIPPETLAHIFEPFYTTKPIGKGTGLGLSVSYGIINKHGGRIEVESEVGKGTAFRVWLPVSQNMAAAEVPAP